MQKELSQLVANVEELRFYASRHVGREFGSYLRLGQRDAAQAVLRTWIRLDLGSLEQLASFAEDPKEELPF